MRRVEKTVFLSYRRSDGGWALAVFYALRLRGFDVFFDFTGLGSGAFDRVILENVRSRAHFVVVLTPRALDRCSDSDDWLRREIEEALGARRNIVPIMIDGFAFNAETKKLLTGKLARLKDYNAHEVSLRTFEADIEALDRRFLNVELDQVVHPSDPAPVLPAPPHLTLGRPLLDMPSLLRDPEVAKWLQEPVSPPAARSPLLDFGPEAKTEAKASAPPVAGGFAKWWLQREQEQEKAAASEPFKGLTGDLPSLLDPGRPPPAWSLLGNRAPPLLPSEKPKKKR